MKKLIQLISITSLIAFSALHAEVDSAESSPKSSTSIESNSAESKGFCAGAHSNTGCFVGVSVGLSPATSRLDIDTNKAGINGDVTNPRQPKKENFSFPIAFDLGYQWYFAQNAGFRFKGYIGYENYSAKDLDFGDKNRPTETIATPLTSHALQYGLEARYLYDFIYGGAHTFGANIGVGFEGSSFFNTAVVGNNLINESKTYTRVTWTSGVGLHYFYKAHHNVSIQSISTSIFPPTACSALSIIRTRSMCFFAHSRI